MSISNKNILFFFNFSLWEPDLINPLVLRYPGVALHGSVVQGGVE